MGSKSFSKRKLLRRVISSVTALFMLAPPVFAAECTGRRLIQRGEVYRNALNVQIDGEEYGGEVFLLANTAYVSVREFSDYSGARSIEWDGNTSTATVTADSLILSVTADEYYIEANGRALWCENGSFVDGGRLYAPLRALSGAFGYACIYDGERDTVYLSREKAAIECGDSFYDADVLYWLSRIINAEAGAEPFFGKIAVGSVIMNRVRSGEFPNDTIGVIFDTENGVQFSPVSNGSIYEEPDRDSVIAAKLTLEGVNVAGDALYFLNVSLAESYWIVNNCSYVMTVGSHDFYS